MYVQYICDFLSWLNSWYLLFFLSLFCDNSVFEAEPHAPAIFMLPTSDDSQWGQHFLKVLLTYSNIYCISANSFRGNYSFLNLTLCTVTFGDSTYRCGNYSREETIQGRKLYEEIHGFSFVRFLKNPILAKIACLQGSSFFEFYKTF